MHVCSVIEQQRIIIKNKFGENLVGVLHETGSTQVIILCHGFTSNRESSVKLNVADALTKEGTSVFRFDFSGNGESEGTFEFGNCNKEADDLHSVVLYFSGMKRVIDGILGESKDYVWYLLKYSIICSFCISYFNCCYIFLNKFPLRRRYGALVYAWKYHDVPIVINVSGCYDMEKGIAELILGKGFMERIKENGFIDVEDKEGRLVKNSLIPKQRERIWYVKNFTGYCGRIHDFSLDTAAMSDLLPFLGSFKLHKSNGPSFLSPHSRLINYFSLK
ncbi:hypothetical protein MKX01_006753 [Papaver californicum]|nr:hypothetical protein MKX01_006753 [Papaver californicum]